MKKNKILVSIYDKKGTIHDNYMIFDYEAQAVKTFKMAIDKNEVFKLWPEDYALYKIAELDQEQGTVTPDFKKIIDATALVPTPDRPKSGTTKETKKD